MGNPRPRPQHLARKLLKIRRTLGLSQMQLIKLMEVDDTVAYHRISEYELGRREPSLSMLLAYARVAGVHLEDIVNDLVELPGRLPGKVKHPGPN
jgi:transcriptional regulator with XRE-family HTH domain